MQEKEVTHKGKKIFYRSIGQGPVVVLLHGVPFDGNLWNRQFDALKDYKLIIPDLPGSGRSELVEDMSMEGMAECIKELIVHETASLFFKMGEPHSVVIIGHSMGGYIALALAEKHPELLKGVGLFHSTAYSDTEERRVARRKAIETINGKGAFEFIKNMLPNLFGPVTKLENPKLVEEQIAASNNFSALSLVNYYKAMMERPDRTNVLKNCKIPMLFILGKYDNAVSLKDGLEQCAVPDLAYIHILESSGHSGMREEPKKANEILKNYLKNIYHLTR